MPKKATKKVDDKKDNIKKVKENLYMDASYIMNLRRVLIPWSPAYDEVLGGGIVSGSMTNFQGAPKTGKTSCLLELAGICQKPEFGGRYWDKEAVKDTGEKPGRPVFFYSVENRLTKRDLSSVHGLNMHPDKFKLIVTTDKRTLYLEDFFENIEQTIDLYPGCVIVTDSVGALCSKTVAEATEGGQVRDPAPLLTSQLMKRIGQLLMAKDVIMLNVLHKVSNTGGRPGQSTVTVTGGKKLKYGANNIIDLKYTQKDVSSDKVKDKNWYVLNIEGETSELGPPGVESKAYLRLGQGLWHEYELIMLVTQPGVNNTCGFGQSGSWYKIDAELAGTEKPVSIQGIVEVANWLVENPKVYKKLYERYASDYFPNRELYK